MIISVCRIVLAELFLNYELNLFMDLKFIFKKYRKTGKAIMITLSALSVLFSIVLINRFCTWSFLESNLNFTPALIGVPTIILLLGYYKEILKFFGFEIKLEETLKKRVDTDRSVNIFSIVFIFSFLIVLISYNLISPIKWKEFINEEFVDNGEEDDYASALNTVEEDISKIDSKSATLFKLVIEVFVMRNNVNSGMEQSANHTRLDQIIRSLKNHKTNIVPLKLFSEFGIAEANSLKGNYNKSINLYKKITIDYQESRYLTDILENSCNLNMANAYLYNGEYKKAIPFFEKIPSVIATQNRGLCYAVLGLDESIDSASRSRCFQQADRIWQEAIDLNDLKKYPEVNRQLVGNRVQLAFMNNDLERVRSMLDEQMKIISFDSHLAFCDLLARISENEIDLFESSAEKYRRNNIIDQHVYDLSFGILALKSDTLLAIDCFKKALGGSRISSIEKIKPVLKKNFPMLDNPGFSELLD